jgi:putative salt-induced outer membrane protein YdiY
MKENASVFALGAVLYLGVAGSASADVIYLKNGDHITGKIQSAEGGKVTFAPDFASDTTVTISQSDIATFTTSGPTLLKLTDGTMIHQPVEQGPPGQVKTAPGGPLAPQPVAIASIEKINPSTAWTGSVSLNGLYSHSATTDLTLGVAADGTRRTDDDRIIAAAAFNYGQQKVDNITTTSANNWIAKAEYDYFLTKAWYAYGSTDFGGDDVNFLTLRFTPSVGAGYQWIDEPDFHFSTLAGVAWIYEDYRTNPGPTETFGLKIGYHIDKSWDSDRIKVFHDLAILPGLTDTDQFLVQADAGIRASLTKSMYSQASFNVTYDNKPAPGTRNTTTQFLIGFGLTY